MSQDDSTTDGLRPDEEVGPDGCEATIANTSVDLEETAAAIDECGFDTTDELQDAFSPTPIPVVLEPDGRANIITPPIEQAVTAPFTRDNVLCVEDDRTYVELQHGFPDAPPSRPPRTFPAAQVKFQRDGIPFVLISEGEGIAYPLYLRPVRERCRFYKRLVIANDDQPERGKAGHFIVKRYCTALRSNGGAFLSLRDEAIYACDFRDPVDKASADWQDAKDKAQLDGKRHLTLIPAMGMPGDDRTISEDPKP